MCISTNGSTASPAFVAVNHFTFDTEAEFPRLLQVQGWVRTLQGWPVDLSPGTGAEGRAPEPNRFAAGNGCVELGRTAARAEFRFCLRRRTAACGRR